LGALLLCAAVATVFAAAQNTPVIGQSPRYLNPLNLPANSNDGSARGVSLGDPTVVRDSDLYYLFATGVTNGPSPLGGAWVSKDLVDWEWKPLAEGSERLPIAPDVATFNGKYYMTGNGAPLYRADNILGPYTEVGSWLDPQGRPVWDIPTTNGLPRRVFDVQLFVDKDNKPYVFMAYGQTGGVWAAPLDPNQPNRMTAAPKDLIKSNLNRVWERAGNANERSNYSFMEGPWVFERDGTYYLQYSAGGTEWQTYATGYYTAKSPLGPYIAVQDTPFLRQVAGVNTGPGHGSAVKGPDGNWWQFYLTVLNNPPGGRRIGMDPIGFDGKGRMFVRGGAPSETPQWAPGVVADPARNGDSGSVPLTFGKMRGLAASSQQPGREAAYAIDNFNGSWWAPDGQDPQPTLRVDLLGIAPFDPLFLVDSARIQFRGLNFSFWQPPRPGQAVVGPAGPGPGPRPEDAPFSGAKTFQYRLEASGDGKAWKTVVDKTSNAVTRYTEFDDFRPTPARYVRLILTDWPRSANQPLGVVEFTVFGKLPSGRAPGPQ
jgi:hypothetical protein